jgi:hypothetical protein
VQFFQLGAGRRVHNGVDGVGYGWFGCFASACVSRVLIVCRLAVEAGQSVSIDVLKQLTSCRPAEGEERTYPVDSSRPNLACSVSAYNCPSARAISLDVSTYKKLTSRTSRSSTYISSWIKPSTRNLAVSTRPLSTRSAISRRDFLARASFFS